MFEITVMWDMETREVGWYDLAQKCKECGTITTTPTPIDWMDCD
jgi:rRNA maturation protein Nop10